MSEISGFLTGFAGSLDKYLQLGTQYTIEQKKEEYKNQLANQSAIAKEGRELANQKELEGYKSQLDTNKTAAVKAYELTLAGKISPEAAKEMYPDLYDAAVKFHAENNRDMTVEEFTKLAAEHNKTKTDKQPKEFQFKAASFYKRAVQGDQDLGKLGDKFTTAYSNVIQDKLPQFSKSPQYRQFSQARDNFINAYLRRDSGAAISASEYDTANRQYFPVPGDDAKTLAQKARNRQGVIESLKQEAEGKAVDLTVPAERSSSGAGSGWSYVGPLKG